jgi:hypothetical protein
MLTLDAAKDAYAAYSIYKELERLPTFDQSLVSTHKIHWTISGQPKVASLSKMQTADKMTGLLFETTPLQKKKTTDKMASILSETNPIQKRQFHSQPHGHASAYLISGSAFRMTQRLLLRPR